MHADAIAPGSWVPREIALLRECRPDGAIHPLIGSGVPTACFPPDLLTTIDDGRTETPLAPDLRPLRDGGGDGEQRGLIRLIAGLLGLAFDDLWRREQRRKRIRRIVTALESAAIAVAVAAAIALGILIVLGRSRVSAWDRSSMPLPPSDRLVITQRDVCESPGPWRHRMKTGPTRFSMKRSPRERRCYGYRHPT